MLHQRVRPFLAPRAYPDVQLLLLRCPLPDCLLLWLRKPTLGAYFRPVDV